MATSNVVKFRIGFAVNCGKGLDEVVDLHQKAKPALAQLAEALGIDADEIEVDARLVRARDATNGQSRTHTQPGRTGAAA